jgi:hypothetical protein
VFYWGFGSAGLFFFWYGRESRGMKGSEGGGSIGLGDRK